jgi:sugar-specific transcriptional regulator TrmB
MRTNVLTSMGISEKAAKVYLSGLSLGTTSIQEIAHKTGLKRPTVYLHIDELVRRGLFEKIAINKKRYYRAADPRILEERLKGNLVAMQQAIPEFLNLQSKTPGKPQVALYEGKEGIETIYRELKEASAVRIWSNLDAGQVLFHDVNMEVAETLGKNGAAVREIIADTKGARRYSRLVVKVAGPTYQVRTGTVDGFANDSIIYDNVITLFRLSENNMFVVRIEDKTIADSMKALFDMAWKSARPFR